MTVQATFAATLVDEWARGGVRLAIVSPGSRSTPLALALASDGRVRVEVVLDERAAGFAALGAGMATGVPAVVLTTSGTAAVEVHPAVVEASLALVPMLVCTADRPPELRDVGAPQAIDQTHLYGRYARWFHDPGVADPAAVPAWRALAARAVAEALGSGGRGPGPVHLNLPFREPLVGEPDELPPGRPGAEPWTRPLCSRGYPATTTAQRAARGVVIAGRGADPALAASTGWPVLADPLSGCRVPAPTTVAAFDPLLRSESFAGAHRPEVVLRLGAPPASRVLSQWLASLGGARVISVMPPGAWVDPEHIATEAVASVDLVGGGAPPDGWVASWAAAEAAAQGAIAAVLAGQEAMSEPGLARALVRGLPDGGTLVVSSSMPVRDVEWYSPPRTGLRILANRGANGIDGVLSTAVGVSVAGGAGTNAVLLGDLAFLHDQGGLVAAAARPGLDLLIAVADNDGGGIFSFLPQERVLDRARFEQLFGTPHGVDLVAVANAHGVPVFTDVEAALDATRLRVLHVRTDRAENVALHTELHAAVAAALASQ
jgi:2-succinyl-5-enolpyruvyl-6-hydroxy-3-cyclohexene-1-carboxylate synthase